MSLLSPVIPWITKKVLQNRTAAFLPIRPENCTDQELAEIKELVDFQIQECKIKHLIVHTGFAGGGMNLTAKQKLSEFLSWCATAHPKLKIILECSKHTKASITKDINTRETIDIAPFQHHSAAFLFIESHPYDRRTVHVLPNRVYRLIVKISSETSQLFLRWFPTALPNAKYTDVTQADIWRQQKTLNTSDQYEFLLSTHGGFNEFTLLTTPGSFIVSCDTLLTYSEKWHGTIGIYDPVIPILPIPYTVPSERDTFKINNAGNATRFAYIALAKSVASFLRGHTNVVALWANGDEPHCWESHQEFINATQAVAHIMRSQTRLPVWMFADGICGHNSDWTEGCMANYPTPHVKYDFAAKPLNLVTWGPYNTIEYELGDALATESQAVAIGLSPHWHGGEDAICTGQAVAASQLSLWELMRVKMVIDYSENIEQAYRSHERFELFFDNIHS